MAIVNAGESVDVDGGAGLTGVETSWDIGSGIEVCVSGLRSRHCARACTSERDRASIETTGSAIAGCCKGEGIARSTAARGYGEWRVSVGFIGQSSKADGLVCRCNGERLIDVGGGIVVCIAALRRAHRHVACAGYVYGVAG